MANGGERHAKSSSCQNFNSKNKPWDDQTLPAKCLAPHLIPMAVKSNGTFQLALMPCTTPRNLIQLDIPGMVHKRSGPSQLFNHCL